MVLLILAVVTAFTAGGWIIVLIGKLRELRTDLKPTQHFGQGKSTAWQQNVTAKENYGPEGRRLLQWLSVAQVLWLLAVITIGVCWVLT